MDLSSITLFAMMKERLGYLSERQSVLAQNVANANTPGYKAQDLEKVDFREIVAGQAKGVHLRATHPGHIGVGAGGGGNFAKHADKYAYERTPVGNEVVLEDQMQRMAGNSIDYQTTTSLYRKMNELMKIAIKGNN